MGERMMRRWGGSALALALFAAAGAAPGETPSSPETRAALELANRLGSGRGLHADQTAAAAIYERLAEEGDPLAQRLLAEAYFSGAGVERRPDLAAQWLEKAAAQNSAPAEGELAYLYVSGAGVPRDYARAFELGRKAADQGAPNGEDVLGLIYTNGWGVAADPAEGIRWLTKAADQKLALAMLHLGQVYRDGIVVPADLVLARAWFNLAATHADSLVERSQAVKARDDLDALLLPDEIARAQQLANEWQPGMELAARRAALAASPAPDIPPAKLPSDINVGPVLVLGAPPPPPPGEQPAVMRLQSVDFDVEPDASFTRVEHTELQVQNEAAAKALGERVLPYRDGLDTVEVVEAYTLKPDGRKLPVEPAAIFTRLAPGAAAASLIGDQWQKVVVFPDLDAGDVMVMTAKYRSQAVMAGVFSLSLVFDPALRQQDVRISVTAPEAMPLQTETHGLKYEERDDGAKRRYEWRYANLVPPPEQPIALSPLERWPRLFASNLRGYDQLGAAYAELAGPKIAVTPAIQKLANEITAETADKRRQAELIYYWVSRHIRYVGIELGKGAIVPHDADTVLANGYGDCKDKAVLLSALLKAKDIASDIVLINHDNDYALSSAPVLSPFDHAISWLPEFGIYVDTTVGVAPFGTLPFPEYGKPVVLATATPPVVRRVPSVPADATTIAQRTVAHLYPDGRVTGQSDTTATGPLSLLLRQQAAQIQSSGDEHAAKAILRGNHLDGTGRLDFSSPFEPGDEFKVSGRFELKPRPELPAGASFFLPAGLMLGPTPGEFLMGSLAFNDPRGDEPTACFAGHQVAEWSLELPEGKGLRDLPKGIEVRNRLLLYRSRWSLSGRTVSVRREFSAMIDRPVCLGELRKIAAHVLSDIRKDYATEIALVDK
jgi:transglutaminase-like putative cysteine protease